MTTSTGALPSITPGYYDTTCVQQQQQQQQREGDRGTRAVPSEVTLVRLD